MLDILVQSRCMPGSHPDRVAPDRTEAILARGGAYGESRVICNVHWGSDVIEGRTTGAATVARLHVDPGFVADLKGAKLTRDKAEGYRSEGAG